MVAGGVAVPAGAVGLTVDAGVPVAGVRVGLGGRVGEGEGLGEGCCVGVAVGSVRGVGVAVGSGTLVGTGVGTGVGACEFPPPVSSAAPSTPTPIAKSTTPSTARTVYQAGPLRLRGGGPVGLRMRAVVCRRSSGGRPGGAATGAAAAAGGARPASAAPNASSPG